MAMFQQSDLGKGKSDGINFIESNQAGNYGNYDDDELRQLPEIERITRLFNLLSHDNIYISE